MLKYTLDIFLKKYDRIVCAIHSSTHAYKTTLVYPELKDKIFNWIEGQASRKISFTRWTVVGAEFEVVKLQVTDQRNSYK